MRGYIETVTRSLRAPARRAASERPLRRPRGRRTTFVPVLDETVARSLGY